jgi:hypothetical protein
MTAIRPIVHAAFKVGELIEQFQNVDVPDGVLVTGSKVEVNEKFNDAYLIGEASNRLDMVKDQLEAISPDHPTDWRIYKRDEKQLKNFIKKWSK